MSSFLATLSFVSFSDEYTVNRAMVSAESREEEEGFEYHRSEVNLDMIWTGIFSTYSVVDSTWAPEVGSGIATFINGFLRGGSSNA